MLCVSRVWLRKTRTKTLCKAGISIHGQLKFLGLPVPVPLLLYADSPEDLESTCIYMATASLRITGQVPLSGQLRISWDIAIHKGLIGLGIRPVRTTEDILGWPET